MALKLRLSPVETAIATLCAAAALGQDEDPADLEMDGFTLLAFDEHDYVPITGWTSPLARRLRARRFPVKMRRVEGGYETWAKWPEEAL